MLLNVLDMTAKLVNVFFTFPEITRNEQQLISLLLDKLVFK